MRANELRYLLIAAGSAVLVACGGGGDDAATTSTTTTTGSTAQVDKYVGTWMICTAAGAGSESESLSFSKTGDATVAYSFTGRAHAGAGCTDAGTVTEQGSGTGTFNGTKTAGSETVDKIIVVEGGASEKIIGLVRNDSLFFSFDPDDAGYAVDAEGYPTAIDESFAFTKQ